MRKRVDINNKDAEVKICEVEIFLNILQILDLGDFLRVFKQERN